MSQESEPSVDPDTPPATPHEVQPNFDPERPLDPPEEPERVDPDHPWIPWRTGDPNNLTRRAVAARNLAAAALFERSLPNPPAAGHEFLVRNRCQPYHSDARGL